jgi:hypothetical protein
MIRKRLNICGPETIVAYMKGDFFTFNVYVHETKF